VREANVTSSPSDDIAGTAAHEYLTFFIAGEEYAVSLEFVREVIPYDTVTRVPGMPETVRGVTNLRGSVVPVIDLALKFRLPEVPVTSRTCIVLVETTLEGAPVLMGLMTEQVGQVLGLAAGELLASPSFGAPVRTDYLLGMAPIGKKFALVLDIRRVLSPKELLVETTPEAATPEAPTVEVAAEERVDAAWETANGSPEPGTEQQAESGA
jgi:purine-binding chemotaxis protein CheW